MFQSTTIGWISVLSLCFITCVGAGSLVPTAPQEEITMTYSDEDAVPSKPPAIRAGKLEEKPFTLSGHRSGIVKPRQVIVRDAKAFATLWKEHTTGIAIPPPLPKVDFQKNDVVAVFMGSKPTGGYSVEIGDIRHEKKGATITVTLLKPGPGSIVTQAFTYPFAMRAVPKLPKTVKFAITEKVRGED
jgi:hypothetical protein